MLTMIYCISQKRMYSNEIKGKFWLKIIVFVLSFPVFSDSMLLHGSSFIFPIMYSCPFQHFFDKFLLKREIGKQSWNFVISAKFRSFFSQTNHVIMFFFFHILAHQNSGWIILINRNKCIIITIGLILATGHGMELFPIALTHIFLSIQASFFHSFWQLSSDKISTLLVRGRTFLKICISVKYFHPFI